MGTWCGRARGVAECCTAQRREDRRAGRGFERERSYNSRQRERTSTGGDAAQANNGKGRCKHKLFIYIQDVSNFF